MIDQLNPYFWICSNLLIGYIAVAITVFAIAYPILFDPNATTAGKFLLRFVASLAGVIGLVIIGTFIDPSHGRAWSEYPGDVVWWRPAVRLGVYAYVAYTITALDVLLWFRKFQPNRLRTVTNEHTLPVKLRNNNRK